MVWETATAHRITFGRHSNSRLAYGLIAAAVAAVVTLSVTWTVGQLVGTVAGQAPPRQLVVLDTDPGLDDAMAIFTLLGDAGVQVRGVTCVRGNTEVPQVANNTLRILQLANKLKVPVYSGSNYGLRFTPQGDSWFGSDGLQDIPLPQPSSPITIQQEHAAAFLARIVRENPGKITVIAIGPLTNLALALHLNPDFLWQVRRVIVLGGSIKGQGNAAPGVEFNFHMDPDAAALVLERATSSNTIITMVPMETCLENDVTLEWRWKTLAKINNSVVSFLNEVEKKQQLYHPLTRYTPYDSFAVCVLLAPDLVLHSQEVYGYVEDEGRRARGSLQVDYVNITQNKPNLDIILEVNLTVLKTKMLENLSTYL